MGDTNAKLGLVPKPDRDRIAEIDVHTSYSFLHVHESLHVC